MIKNDKEFAKEKSRLQLWNQSFEETRKQLSKDAFKVYEEIHRPIVNEIQKEISEYETLKYAQEEPAYFDHPIKVGTWIIRQRVRNGFSQRKFGEKLHLSQSQISRDEDNEYSNSPFMRIYEIFKVFGFKFFELAFFKSEEEMTNFKIKKSLELIKNEPTPVEKEQKLVKQTVHEPFVGLTPTTANKSQLVLVP